MKLSVQDTDNFAVLNSKFNPAEKYNVVGYVFNMQDQNPILITAGPEPYFISDKLVKKYFLSFGDKVEAIAAFSIAYDCHLLIDIKSVNGKIELLKASVHFYEMDSVLPNKEFVMDGIKLCFGDCIAARIHRNENIHRKKEDLAVQCPRETIKLELLVDGRIESDYMMPRNIDYRYRTQVVYNKRSKMMICLTAFFHACELAECGNDVIMFIDNIEKLFDIYCNSADKKSSLVLSEFEKVLRSGKALSSGGSLTVIGLYGKSIGGRYRTVGHRLAQICDNVL